MNITVNGQKVTIEPLPGEMLSDLLRQRLGLTGTKIGCNEAECGSCTVLVDGIPVLSCAYPSAKVEGKNILTIEGLASLSRGEGKGDVEEPELHPLQEAFISHGAVQCGFCIPGQIMTAYALLQSHPDPTEAEIRYAPKDTLCRCAGYPTIIRAIQEAADSMRTGELPQPPQFPLLEETPTHKVIGTLQSRPDSIEKVTGVAKFTDDLNFEGMLHAAVKRAGVPHAILKCINTQKARELPGVVAVLTAEDIPGEHYHGLVIKDWPSLVGIGERVRYVATRWRWWLLRRSRLRPRRWD